ncbi:MAG: nucleotidyl transferase AbiEii/AbiGii toxin family protein [Acidimicrobiales bacterium]
MGTRRPRSSSDGEGLESTRSQPVVDQDVLDILHRIASSKLGGCYYLAGGTALALQIGHRRSNDLDYFTTADSVDRPSIEKILSATLSSHGRPEVALSEAGQLDFLIGKRRRKVSFIAYPFPSPRPKVTVEHQPCSDVLEIASMKAYAIGRRGAARDYVDIEACISKGGVSLEEIVSAAKSQFVLGEESLFSERMFLQQLVYTEDLDDKEGLMLYDSSFKEVERSLRHIVARYVEDAIS